MVSYMFGRLQEAAGEGGRGRKCEWCDGLRRKVASVPSFSSVPLSSRRWNHQQCEASCTELKLDTAEATLAKASGH